MQDQSKFNLNTYQNTSTIQNAQKGGGSGEEIKKKISNCINIKNKIKSGPTKDNTYKSTPTQLTGNISA